MIFCCFRCVTEQWALTVIKASKVFCINISCFYHVLFSCTTVVQSHPSFIKMQMFLISTSKLVHAFGLQTPITAECTMRRCKSTAVAMATATRRTYRGHYGMRPPKFHPNRSIGRRVTAFPIFCNMEASAILNMNFVILDHPRSQLCGLITTSKFGIDPIFPAGDIKIL